jgi:type II secretory pathway component PulF
MAAAWTHARPATGPMAEFVIKLADERGRVQEQVQTAASAEELRTRFLHAGYHVFSVKARGGMGGLSRRKVKLEPFLIFNQQFLTLIRAGPLRPCWLASDRATCRRCWSGT